MRKILLGTTAVVGAALIGVGAAQAQTVQGGPAGGVQTVTAPSGPQAPTVRVGGYLQTTFAWVNDNLDYARGAPQGVNAANTALATTPRSLSQARSKNDFRNEVEIWILVNGKAANGMTYGATVEIQNDNSGNGSGSGLDLDEAYVFIGSPTLGTVRFGEEDSAASIMQVRAPTITGFGADGAWDVGILGTANGTGGNPSILTGINDGNDSTKVIYLSPQFFGFDFGASYAANAGEGDRAFFGRAVDTLGAGGTNIAPSVTQRDRTGLNNEYSAALRYRGSFGNVGLAASATGMWASAQRTAAANATGNTANLTTGQVVTTNFPTATIATQGGNTLKDISAYSFGLQATAFGFTVGGEYTFGNYAGTSVGRTALANNPDGSARDQSSHWLLGVTYVMGAWSFGGYYGQGEQDNGTAVGIGGVNAAGTALTTTTLLNPSDRKQTGWGLGAAYTLAPGLELFASYNNVQDKNVYITLNGGTLVNRNYEGVFLGTRLAF